MLDLLYRMHIQHHVRSCQLVHLILLGSMRSMSLSFFQKSCGGGEASTLHSNLTVSPSRALVFNIFWMKVGGRRTSWAAYRIKSLYTLVKYSKTFLSFNGQVFTYYMKPHGEPALPSSVCSHTLIHTGMMHRDDLDDERVHSFLTHQHLVVVVRTNGLTIQIPRNIWSWKTTNLQQHLFYRTLVTQNTRHSQNTLNWDL